MDVHAHQPEEEFADFTENELLSLIDAGTAGAYSEIYRRYRDDVVARASSSLPPAKARQITDDAFLSVLRSLLNGSADTAEGLRSLVDSTVDEHIAHSTPPHDSYSHDDDFPGGAGAPEATLVSQALSTLPDNWQRILWLVEVERLSPEAVADRLNIKVSTIERLAGRARQNLKDEWQRVRPTNSETTADHRSALIPALLTSPIVIERLSDTLAQAIPEPAPADADTSTVETAAADTSTAEPSEADTAAGAGAGAGAAEPAETSFVVGTGADPAGTTAAPAAAAPAGTKADLADATAAGASTETLGASAGTAGNSAGATDDTNTVEPAVLAAFGAHPATAGTLTQTPAPAGFRMPKPVLIPVVAACIGLLGTLVGVAIVPQHGEQTGFRPGSASTGVSPADASSEQGDKRSTSGSPDDTNSGAPGQRSGSGKSKASNSGRDGNDKPPQSPGHDGHRADKGSSAAENPGDDADNSSNSSRDSPSAGEPGDPAPSDSDKSDPKSPSEPTPSTPDDPESPPEPSPSQPDEPTPTDPPATDPPPSEEPTEPPPPPEEPSPSEPPPSDSGAPSEPEPTQDGSSSAPSASN